MRYVLTLDLYLYEDNDRKAIAKAKEYAALLRELDDNHADIVSIHSKEFGETRATPINFRK